MMDASYALVSFLVIFSCITPVLFILRFLYLQTTRAVRTIRMQYHKRVTRDWWSVYIERCRWRPIVFSNTDYISNYELDFRANDIDIRRRTRICRLTLVERLKNMTNALINNEIYLRIAHYSYDGFLGQYTVDIACCIGCSAHLPDIACFICNNYYCLACIKTEVLPRFCGERLCLLGATGLLPDELVDVIARNIALLSFDHRQIHMDISSVCQCDLYDCRRKDKMDRVLDLQAELSSLRKTLLPR